MLRVMFRLIRLKFGVAPPVPVSSLCRRLQLAVPNALNLGLAIVARLSPTLRKRYGGDHRATIDRDLSQLGLTSIACGVNALSNLGLSFVYIHSRSEDIIQPGTRVPGIPGSHQSRAA